MKKRGGGDGRTTEEWDEIIALKLMEMKEEMEEA